MKRYIVSYEARADVDGIWEYIAARSSEETASKFIGRIEDMFAAVAQSPSAGVVVKGSGHDVVRRFSMGNYLIYYRVVRSRVTIWRVVHGRRLQSRALGTRGRHSR